eukprot:symbB.v1.2.018140.t1/scaffold1430.1/size119332/4
MFSACAGVIQGLAIPTVLFFILRRLNKRNLLKDPISQSVLGMLYNDFEPEYWWYEMGFFVKKFLFMASTAIPSEVLRIFVFAALSFVHLQSLTLAKPFSAMDGNILQKMEVCFIFTGCRCKPCRRGQFAMPQNEYIKESIKRYGRRFDHEERMRKKKAREPKKIAKTARKLRGIKAKLFTKKRYTEKATMKKTIKAHQEKDAKAKDAEEVKPGAVPAYLLDREQVRRTKVLSNMIKQKRKEKAGKWQVPIPKVKAMTEDEMFKILRSGKRKKKAWKRIVNKVSFVGDNFTRKPPKFERYIRPSALRMKKAHVTHPELKMTFCLEIVSVKKNPQSALYTNLGVITKGTIIEVNVSELGLVTQTGKVIFAKYAQVTNNPDIDGCINALLLV